MSTEKEEGRKFLIGLIIMSLVVVYGIYDWRNNTKKAQERRERQEQWRQTPAGMDHEAKLHSISRNIPIRSKTGTLFFKGMNCRFDCSGHIAGYRYALDYGLTNVSKCEESPSLSFEEGCKKGADDILSEIESELK